MVWPDDDDDGPGRGAPVGKLTFQGTEVQDPNELNKRLNSQWRSRVLADSRRANVPKDAGCYLQVAEEELASKTICGPVRFGDEKTTWMGRSLTVEATGVEDTDSRVGSQGRWTERAKPLPNATVTTADGARADFDQRLDPPPAKRAAVGKVVYNVKAKGAVPVKISDDDKLDLDKLPPVKPAQFAGRGKGRRQAPEGGSFVTVGIVSSSDPVLITLRSGGRAYKLPPMEKPRSDGSVYVYYPLAVAVAGDGKDATVELTHKNKVHRYSASSGGYLGEKTSKAPGASFNGTSSECDEYRKGDRGKDGRRIKVTCSIDWSVENTPPKGEGAPKHGYVWVRGIVTTEAEQFYRYTHEFGSFDADYASQVTVRSASMGSIKARVSGKEPDTITMQVPKDAPLKDVRLSVSVNGTFADQSSSPPDDAPEEMNDSAVLTARGK